MIYYGVKILINGLNLTLKIYAVTRQALALDAQNGNRYRNTHLLITYARRYTRIDRKKKVKNEKHSLVGFVILSVKTVTGVKTFD